MPVEIIPHLWLGDYKDAENVTPNTGLVVNCTHNIPFFSENARNIRIPVDDLDDHQEQAIMLKHWSQTDLFELISNHIMQGHDVLVHCQMGRQRSAATIAAFLMTSGKTKDDAISQIRSKKREALFPAVNFDEALNRWDQCLSPNPS